MNKILIQKNMFKLLFIALFFALVAVIVITPKKPTYKDYLDAATPQLQTSYMLDGSSYTKKELIEDFLEVAFNDYVYRKHPSSRYAQVLDPRFVDLFQRLQMIGKGKNQFDNKGRIHKWAGGRITIGLGYPVHSDSDDLLQQTGVGRHYSELLGGFYSEIDPYLRDLAVVLQRETGMQMDVRGYRAKEDATEDFSRIRLVPFRPNLFNEFKKDFPSSLKAVSRAVFFTPNERSQVNGLVVPDVNDDIVLAMCGVTPEFSRDLADAGKVLAKECVLRALGLTQVTTRHPSSVLGAWNREFDAYFRLPHLDGLKKSAIVENFPMMRIIREVPKDYSKFLNLSDYDLMMVKILYCKDIKSGMDKIDVVKVLTGSDSCF